MDTQVIDQVNIETVSDPISRMTCEIGCAKVIRSKLSNEQGIIRVKAVFFDCTATVDFDVNKISTKEIPFSDTGISGENSYTFSLMFSKKQLLLDRFIKSF